MSFPTDLHTIYTLVDNVDDALADHPNVLSAEIRYLEDKVGLNSSSVNTTLDYFLKHASGAYRTHTHDGSSDDGSNIPIANVTNGVNDNAAQSIAGVKTFSSFPITPSSAPTTDYQVANKKYVNDQEGEAPAFGAWDSSSYSNNTNYQAATDGIVCAGGEQENSSITGYSDSSNPPTTMVAQNWIYSNTSRFASITFPVKKNDYWKVTNCTGTGAFIRWLPRS